MQIKTITAIFFLCTLSEIQEEASPFCKSLEILSLHLPKCLHIVDVAVPSFLLVLSSIALAIKPYMYLIPFYHIDAPSDESVDGGLGLQFNYNMFF